MDIYVHTVGDRKTVPNWLCPICNGRTWAGIKPGSKVLTIYHAARIRYVHTACMKRIVTEIEEDNVPLRIAREDTGEGWLDPHTSL